MSLWDRVRHLPLHIDGYNLEPLEREVAREFTLRRTVVVLHGRGEEGRGEEVDYDPRAQQAFQADEGTLPFAGEHTLQSFSLLQAGQTETAPHAGHEIPAHSSGINVAAGGDVAEVGAAQIVVDIRQ